MRVEAAGGSGVPGTGPRRLAPAGAAGRLLLLLVSAAGLLGVGGGRALVAGPAADGVAPAGGLRAGEAPLERAAPRSWRLQSFRAEVQVRPDGWVVVTETIRPRFRGRYNGIYREIPVEYRTPGGWSYGLDLEVLSVTDGGGRKLRYESSRDGDHRRLKIWVPGAEDATRTVRIRYRTLGAIRFDETHEELYWNVTGTEWPVPIDSARVRVRVPEGASGLRASAFAGPYGSTREVEGVQVEGRTVSASHPGDLSAREGLTIAVLWDAGAVSRPGIVTRAVRFLSDNWPLGFALAGVLGMFALWYARGRDPDPGTITVRYEPPDGLSPAEAGVLTDHAADPRDLGATLVDLAVRGYLTIEEGTGGEAPSPDEDEPEYTFRLERPEDDWERLRPHERSLLGALFPGGRAGATTDTAAMENRFYEDLDEVKSALFSRGPLDAYLRGRSDRVRKRFWTAALLVAGLGLTVGGNAASLLGVSPVSVMASAVILGAAVFGFGHFMPARTRSGTAALREVLGFEEFLRRVEEDRYRRMITGPEMFEAHLPYAMALGVEKQWARGFADLVDRPPDWYEARGGGGFTPTRLAGRMHAFSDRTGAAMTSRPRSARSGGTSSAFSGGGGFSGGGFGGGGGGAF